MRVFHLATRRGVITALAACTALTLVGVGACGSNPTPPADATPQAPATSAAPATPSTPDALLIEITVSGGKVSPPPGRVDVALGEQVRLVVHSDVADQVHVHGYDLEAEMAPGQDAVIEFTAELAGLFEVETHNSGLVLTQLVIQ